MRSIQHNGNYLRAVGQAGTLLVAYYGRSGEENWGDKCGVV